MTRRGELRDIGSGLVGSFVSRNNDVGGYWALGLLRSLADRGRTRVLRFDLKTGSSEPPAPPAERVAQTYRERLEEHLARKGIPNDFIVQAILTVEFGVEATPFTPAPTDGQLVRCTALLLDRRNREHRHVALTACAPHDPTREIRSTRAKP